MTDDENILEKSSHPAHGADAGTVCAGGGAGGVRLENELLVREGETNAYGTFMYLEPITFVPMDLDAINPEIMTEEDRKLLNHYHKEVFAKVSPYLDEEESKWLKKYTREI